MGEKAIQLNDLPPQHLMQLKNDLEQEITFMQNALSSIQKTRMKNQEALSTIEQFKSVKTNDEIMVPLSTALYVPGKVANNDSFLIDVGTGYFVEKNLKDSVEYYNRKIKSLTEKIEENTNFIQQKAMMQNMVVQTIRAKQSEMVAAAQLNSAAAK